MAVSKIYPVNGRCRIPARTCGWFGTFGPIAYKTTDGGGTWTPITLDLLGNVSRIDFKNVNTGLASGNGGMARTTDGGTSWEMITKPAEGGNWFIVYYADRYICDNQKVSTS